MKLAVVDDDSLLCSALSRCLIRLGHSSRMATSVDGALALIASESPAAVLTDLDLGGGGDGVDLISRLRASGSRVPILMMTGSDKPGARARLDAAGHVDVPILEKPFEFGELVRRLSELLPPGFLPVPSTSSPPPRGRGTPISMAALMGTVVDRVL